MRTRQLLLSAALALAWPGEALAKIGLETNLSELVIENAKRGRAYNLRDVKGVAFKVKNIGDAPAEIVAEVLVPKQGKLVQGYEPIPDPSWVRVVPDGFSLPPGGNAFLDIILQIPDDPALEGRHFQFQVWTHSKGGGFYAAGLDSRFRFSLGKGPETLEAEKTRKKMLSFNFDLWPQTLYVAQAKSGERYDPKKKEGKSLRVINKMDEPLVLTLKSVPWKQEAALPEGFQPAPDPGWLRLKKDRVKVKGLSITDVAFQLDIPEGHAGKRYAFWLEPALESGLTLSNGAKVLVTVTDK